MELIIHFTALPEKLTLDMVKSDLAELLEDDGWLTGTPVGIYEYAGEGIFMKKAIGILQIVSGAALLAAGVLTIVEGSARRSARVRHGRGVRF